MAVDWSLILGAAIGASIGLLGDPDEYGTRPAKRLMLVLFYEHFAFRSPEVRQRRLAGIELDRFGPNAHLYE